MERRLCYGRGINPTGPRGAPEPVIWILWDCFGACSGHRTDITRERTGHMPTDRPGPEGVYGKVVISVHPRMKVDSKHRNVGFLGLSGRWSLVPFESANSHKRTLCRGIIAATTTGPPHPSLWTGSLAHQLVPWKEYRPTLHLDWFSARLAFGHARPTKSLEEPVLQGRFAPPHKDPLKQIDIMCPEGHMIRDLMRIRCKACRQMGSFAR